MTAAAMLLSLLLPLLSSAPDLEPSAGPLVASAPGVHTVVPFDDESGPKVVCAPLLVCDVALETGEVITDLATGDARNWFVQSFTSGPRETPHVVVKPQDYDLATNLIVATSRRTYHLHLVSPAEAQVHARGFRYDRLVSFSYPAATLEHLSQRAVPLAAADAGAPTGRCGDPTCWSWRYRISPGRFSPLRVLDDGAHVYIQRSTDQAPALFEVLPDRSTAPLTYRFSADSRWIIVDKLFTSARLEVRIGRRTMKTEIERIQGR